MSNITFTVKYVDKLGLYSQHNDLCKLDYKHIKITVLSWKPRPPQKIHKPPYISPSIHPFKGLMGDRRRTHPDRDVHVSVGNNHSLTFSFSHQTLLFYPLNNTGNNKHQMARALKMLFSVPQTHPSEEAV